MKLIIGNTLPLDVKDNEIFLSPLLSHNVLGNIDEYVGDSEAEEIEVLNLNQIPLHLLGNTLSNYVRKLRKGGRITIHGRDLYAIALRVVNRTLDLGGCNQALFGGPAVNEMVSSLVGIEDISGHLQSLGLKIASKTLNGINFQVVGERI